MYDCIIIGAGLSSLSAGSLLSKRGLKVLIVDKCFTPGGSCGIFKRKGAIFDQGSAMIYGFGEKGFNSHRFLFNCLEEPIDVIKHKSLYSVYYKGEKIEFHYDINKYIEELSTIFPEEKENLKRFYGDMTKIYNHVMGEIPVYSTPDETDPKDGLVQFMKHPLSYIKFLSYLNISAEKLLKRYFNGDDILNFFNKLTSTYCYTNVKETPAVLAAIMFIDNHRGGSFYPAGSTIFLPGLLEKVIEENGGEILYEREVKEIIIEENKAKGIVLDSGEKIYGENIIYSGTVWNLYSKLLNEDIVSPKKKKFVSKLKASYPSTILYALVEKEVIPEGTLPITLFTESETKLDEDEVTVYIFSIDDKTLCDEKYHTVMAIGPTFKKWPKYSKDYRTNPIYKKMKEEEEERLLNVLEKRFKGFKNSVIYKEVSTPLTIEKYTMKNNGSVAGPIQSMGQHMLKRQHIKTDFKNLYCCGESTTLGTGTPTVTVSGIAAANAVLRNKNLEEFKHIEGMKNYVREYTPPYTFEDSLLKEDPDRELKKKASKCEYCQYPTCMKDNSIDIRGINRRITVGNFIGASNKVKGLLIEEDLLYKAEKNCKLNKNNEVVEIFNIINELKKKAK